MYWPSQYQTQVIGLSDQVKDEYELSFIMINLIAYWLGGKEIISPPEKPFVGFYGSLDDNREPVALGALFLDCSEAQYAQILNEYLANAAESEDIAEEVD